MSSYKNVVALIVESDDLSSLKLWYLGHQCLEHASNGVTKSCVKVIEY